jgi:hypothetical protein
MLFGPVPSPIPSPCSSPPLSSSLSSSSPLLSLSRIIVPPSPPPPIVLCVSILLLPSSTVSRPHPLAPPLHPRSSCLQQQWWVLVHGGVLVAGPSLCRCDGGGGRGCRHHACSVRGPPDEVYNHLRPLRILATTSRPPTNIHEHL